MSKYVIKVRGKVGTKILEWKDNVMLTTWLFTKLKGKCVGIDVYGNVYFTERALFYRPLSTPARRWVIYKGIPEASKVPPEWYGWLHGITDTVPSPQDRRYSWQKPHKPNLTGTIDAYHPQQKKKLQKESFDYYRSWESSKLQG